MFSLLLVLALPLFSRAVAVSNSATSLTLLYQNNLNGSDDVNHVGLLLLDELEAKDALAACQALNESLLSKSTIESHSADILQSLAYLEFVDRVSSEQLYYIENGVVSFSKRTQKLNYPALPPKYTELPVLCTQSSNDTHPANSTATTGNQITVASTGNTFVGYRNKKSFRFLGIPYADTPKRFVYSSLYSSTGGTINATAYGPKCAQGGSGSEDCLFLNIQTPYIPKKGDKSDLRPVMFWIHGGGFTGGSGADQLSDGGNLASREDIVVVNINYRLSTLGFLAIPGTDIKGNYGISDQVTALEWVVKNIASFGGDPKQITINGESAGAGSVRVLLGSPPAIGNYQGAIAMSNLGGQVTLGLPGGYATTYSSYLTVNKSYAIAGQKILEAAGCNQTTLDSQIACLKALPALTVTSLSPVARFVVQDGKYVNAPELTVTKPNPGTAHVPVIFGIIDNDGASFSTYPQTPVITESEGLQAALGISASYAQSVIDSGLFPYYNTGNITLDSFNVSQRIATDMQFRCIDSATVYAAQETDTFESSYYYEMQRTIRGYDPNNLGGPPTSPGYPNGNPNLPYFKLHGSDMPRIFGTLSTLRDANDLYSVQLISGYFAEFVKTGQPNPSKAYLTARGYGKTLEAIEKTGPWEEVSGKKGPIKLLDYPSVTSSFIDVPQCAFLNYSLSYYLEGGK
ncbi:related to acetylcholinesterase precursor [Rhynchosporium secalis]|uniref:Carboxylic ester hydrolase n=1 Tax=Rhynchosporium secalis TaxID=38038 RepID=A0A1E1LZS5_RHYSE|nr:related to acetylcholinesterase precursor [Rhynchosporium secalis]